ncbi:MAG: hypothetical protein SPD90_09535 [Intestinibacter sp.]|uniref:hypothetical protein n=1 Tax=Intestinibacter sp. TaxID=1965304 RepID=UPI002A81454F|nr:hypothetical protein [Intestinibacter sp.]MDY4575286.1 hypothetical protein [Intestinibacter sp.]
MNIKEKAKDMFDVAKEPAFEMTCELMLDGVVGTVVPGISNIYLSYKQKRQEKMFIEFMHQIKDKIEILEEKLNNMNQEQYNEFKEKYFGLVSDYVLNEVQEVKIKYIVNGFINLADIDKINEDFVLTYYDTLEQLRIIDIEVLRLYYDNLYVIDKERTYIDIMREYSIDNEQYTAIREKLVRLGLLTTQREKDMDNLFTNILNMQEYLEKTYKGKTTKLKSFKRINKNDSFKISKFGREFIKFFINEVNKS